MAYGRARKPDEPLSENIDQCREKALNYLSLRDHGSGELYKKLCDRFTPETAATVVARMCEVGLLDDARFALHRGHYLMQQRKSRRQVVQALTQLGVDRIDIDTALEQLYDEAEEDPEQTALTALIEKQYSRKLAQGKQENVLAALCRRGFAYSAAKNAIEEYYTKERENENL